MILELLISLHEPQFRSPLPPKGFKVGVPSQRSDWDADQVFKVVGRDDKVVVCSYSGKNAQTDGPQLSEESPLWIPCNPPLGGFRMNILRGTGSPFKTGELFLADMGEYGGFVAYLDAKSDKPEFAIQKNTKAVGVDGDSVLALTGLSHLGMDETGIYKLTRGAKEWKRELVSTLKEVPGIACWNGKAFVVGGFGPVGSSLPSHTSLAKRIVELSVDGTTRVLTSFSFSSYRTESMAITADGTIWLGGLRFVAALQPRAAGGYGSTFFVPKNFGKKS